MVCNLSSAKAFELNQSKVLSFGKEQNLPLEKKNTEENF